MKLTHKLILTLAVVSILVSAATLYLDSEDSAKMQGNSSAQFQVGVTVRDTKAQNQTAFQKFQKMVASWFD